MSLQNIKGIGPKSENILNKMSILNANDLITYYPYRYNIIEVKPLLEQENLNRIVVKGRISSTTTLAYFKKKMNCIRFKAEVESKLINIVIFNRQF